MFRQTPGMAADLHLHSLFSDGTDSPETLVRRAQDHGLRVIALTDHDTVEGCARAATASAAAGIDFIPATELTADLKGTEIHVLGYGIRIEDRPFLGALARFQQVRQERVRKMVSHLNRLGVPLQADAVLRFARCQSPGRPHVGQALVEGGFCASVDEAFERFLKRGRPAWAPKFKMSSADAIALIHQAGGVAVLAHPGLNRVDAAIPSLVEEGLDGLECLHTRHSADTRQHYLALAERLGLLVTGGSDCHGMTKGQPLMGAVRLPMPQVEALRARIAERQAPRADSPPVSPLRR